MQFYLYPKVHHHQHRQLIPLASRGRFARTRASGHDRVNGRIKQATHTAPPRWGGGAFHFAARHTWAPAAETAGAQSRPAGPLLLRALQAKQSNGTPHAAPPAAVLCSASAAYQPAYKYPRPLLPSPPAATRFKLEFEPTQTTSPARHRP